MEILTGENRLLYLKLRCEIMNVWQMRNNQFASREQFEKVNGLCYNDIAERQLRIDEIDGKYRITLEEMLLYSVDECIKIMEQRNIEKIAKIFRQ